MREESREKLVLMTSALVVAFIACSIIITRAAKININISAGSEASRVFFYFGPMWYAVSYYFFRKTFSKKFMSTHAAVALAFAYGFVLCFGETLGFWNSLIWVLLMSALFLFLLYKKFEPHYAAFISVLMAIFMTEVWEIPIHCITIGKSLTFEQFSLTAMLSSTYLVLAVPLFLEFRAFSMHREFVSVLIFGTLLMALPFALFQNSNGLLFQPNGYPKSEVNYIYRLIWSAVSVFLVLKIPRRVK